MKETSNENTLYPIFSPYTSNTISNYKVLVPVLMKLDTNQHLIKHEGIHYIGIKNGLYLST